MTRALLVLLLAPATVLAQEEIALGPSPAAQVRPAIDAVLADTANMNNEMQRRFIDALAMKGAPPDIVARRYAGMGMMYFLRGYYDEAIYTYAEAALIDTVNPEVLNNLATALLERGKADLAEPVLRTLAALYPNLESAHANLGLLLLAQGNGGDARAELQRALALSPTTGLYHYALGEALDADGNPGAAQRQYDTAWIYGYAGSGHKGEPKEPPPGQGSSGKGKGTGKSGSPGTNAGQNSQTHPGPSRTPAPPPPAEQGPPIPEEWVGHYAAEYVRGKTLHKRQYGSGLTGTLVTEDILVCAKEFSMEIRKDGSIDGHGRLMYVFLGKADNPMMGMMPGFAVAGLGNFMATLKDGFQMRDWTFNGRVDAQGHVEVRGIPQQPMDFYNVGRWQTTKPWSAFPPPDREPQGPARMVLANDKDGTPTIYVSREVTFSDDMHLTYQAYIRKTDENITCDCRRIEPPKPKCPASEYLKVKSSIGADGKMTVEASKDVKTGETTTSTKVTAGIEGEGMAGSVSVEGSGAVTFEGKAGMLVGSTQYNPVDGTYQATIGLGMDSGQLLPGPNKISEKIELIYDSQCGWGVKGSMGATGMSMGAGVEGAIFFTKGA